MLKALEVAVVLEVVSGEAVLEGTA